MSSCSFPTLKTRTMSTKPCPRYHMISSPPTSGHYFDFPPLRIWPFVRAASCRPGLFHREPAWEEQYSFSHPVLCWFLSVSFQSTTGLVVEPTHLKNMLVKMGIFSKLRWTLKVFETTTSCFFLRKHHNNSPPMRSCHPRSESVPGHTTATHTNLDLHIWCLGKFQKCGDESHGTIRKKSQKNKTHPRIQPKFFGHTVGRNHNHLGYC